MIKKARQVILWMLLFYCMLLIGCTSDEKVNVTIEPGIEKYSPLMSSVPGFPLAAKMKVDGDSKKQYTYHWSTDYGQFLTWKPPAGKVRNLGKDVKIEENTLYWSPLVEGEKQASNIRITLEVLNKRGTVLARDQIELVTDEDFFVTVKKSPVETQEGTSRKSDETPSGRVVSPEGTSTLGRKDESSSDTRVLAPDGKHVVSVSGDNGQSSYKVLLHSMDGTKVEKSFDITGRDMGFLWSHDSKKVCVTYSGRIWKDFSIIDVEQGLRSEHPTIVDMIKQLKLDGEKIEYQLREYRSDPYVTPIEWSPDSKKLLVYYEWSDTESATQNGVFVYDTETKKASNMIQYPKAEGHHNPIKKPDHFQW